MEFPQESHAGKRESLNLGVMGTQKGFIAYQTTLQEKTGWVSAWWVLSLTSGP